MTLRIALAPLTGLAILVASTAPAKADPGHDEARSPDGRQVAYIKAEPGEVGASGNPRGSLWLRDTRSGASRLLLRGTASDDPHRDLASLAHPVFSLDGGFIYVEADALATSPAVHQVSVRTGRERFLAEGGIVGVLRSGPWRGFLLIQQHRYRAAGGTYDPVVVYRPDGKEMAIVPGSSGPAGSKAVAPWLKAKGWTAF